MIVILTIHEYLQNIDLSILIIIQMNDSRIYLNYGNLKYITYFQILIKKYVHNLS